MEYSYFISLVFFCVWEVMKMRIERIINNNVVSAIDPNGKEVVVMGKGIGFQAKAGQEIKQELMEKVFRLDSQSAVDKFKHLIETLPLENIQVSNDIITYADKVLDCMLNPNIYITLTDHISFAIERFRQGMLFENPLLWDVQHLYKQEYLIGEYSVALIEKKIGIKLPVDEAASIALHIVNAEYNTELSKTMNITKVVLPNVLSIIEKGFDFKLKEETIQYERFVTYLKFLVQRIIKKDQENDLDPEFGEMVNNLYQVEHKVGNQVGNYLGEYFQEDITPEELAMLAINLRRMKVSGRK